MVHFIASPDPIDVEVGGRIRQRRRWLGLSQTQLAEAVGVTFQQIQKYERGGNRVAASMLVNIAAKLETSVAALVGEQEGGDAVESAMYTQLADPGSTELLAAYARIAQGDSRRAVLALAEALAAADARRGREGPAPRALRRRRQDRRQRRDG